MSHLQTAFLRTQFACFMMFGFLNLFFMRDLIIYQSGSQAAQFLGMEYPGAEGFMLEEDLSYSFDFYMGGEVKHRSIHEIKLERHESFLFCNEMFIPLLKQEGMNVAIIKVFPHYHISEPRPPFLNADTRSERLNYYALIKIF